MKKFTSKVTSVVAGIALAFTAMSCSQTMESQLDSASASVTETTAEARDAVSATGSENYSLTVDYLTDTQFSGAFLYVSDGNGLAAARRYMTHTEDGYTLTLTSSSFTEGAVLSIYILTMDDGVEGSVFGGNLADVSTWVSFNYTASQQLITVSNETSDFIHFTTASAPEDLDAASTQPVFDGTYTFTARCSGKVLSVADSSTANYANAEQESYTDKASQKWTVAQVSEGVYTIQNVNSGKYLDVNLNTKYMTYTVVQNSVACSPFTKWHIVMLNNGCCRIYNDAIAGYGTDLNMDVFGGDEAEGADVWMSEWTASDAQLWTLSAVDAE